MVDIPKNPFISSKKRQCDRKIKYKTQKKAGEGLFRNHGFNNDLNTYLCPHCRYWHVGHKIRRLNMVKIPTYGDLTIQAMYREIEKKPRDKRNYLGASLIGNDCARQIYYSYNGYTASPFSAQTLMNFEDGHRTEDLTADRLRMVDGVNLITHGDDGKQLGFSAIGGKFKGHYDGIITGLIQAPKAKHIWENKCSAEKKYKEFQNVKAKFGEKNALKNWNTNYYVQHQLYMHYEGLDRGYLTVAKAGGRDYESARTDYDEAVAAKYIDRADKIINAKTPPPKINEKKDFFICRWCDFKDICHG